LERESVGLIYRACRAILRLLGKVYLRHSATGREQVPARGGFILAVNHASHLDPVLAGISLARPLHFVGRKTLFRPAVFGWFLRKLHAVSLDLEGVGKECFREILEKLKAGSGVMLFPEGTRSRDGELGCLRSGIVYLAKNAEVPVVPTWVEGSGRAMAPGVIIPRPRRTSVHYGEPLWFPADASNEECLAAVRESMLALRAPLIVGRESIPDPVPRD
jgi:1-acyl-sn-glycerol-3-phosphate acyltransferase